MKSWSNLINTYGDLGIFGDLKLMFDSTTRGADVVVVPKVRHNYGIQSIDNDSLCSFNATERFSLVHNDGIVNFSSIVVNLSFLVAHDCQKQQSSTTKSRCHGFWGYQGVLFP
jgi:hypothetical protein